VPYLFTRRTHITPLVVIARGVRNHHQSERPCDATAEMAIARRINPVTSVPLATVIGRLMLEVYPALTGKRLAPKCRAATLLPC
jgi:hypothetical protein